MSNFVIRELTLYRHYLLIDSPISFEFIANPTNYNKDMSDFSRVTGLDVCSRPAGCWRVDCWKLLPKEFQRNNPVFTMLLKYDADLLAEGEVVDVRYSDIDVGEGVAGVNGQLVQILPSTFQPVVYSIDALQTSNHGDLGLVKNSVDALQTSNHGDLLAVKNSVDALQTLNHGDLLAVKNSVDALSGSSQHFIFNERTLHVLDIGDVGRYVIPTFYASSPVSILCLYGDGRVFFSEESFPTNYINKYICVINVSETATPDGMKFKFEFSLTVNGSVTSRDFLMSSPFQNISVVLFFAGGARD